MRGTAPVGRAADQRRQEEARERQAASKEIGAILSRREIDVVRGVASGLRNREIAERLGIAEGTVKLHLHTVYTNRTSLIPKLNEKAFV